MLVNDRHFPHFSRSTSEYARQRTQFCGELARSTELFLDKYVLWQEAIEHHLLPNIIS
ncbi:hypothetical protein [Chamaesiphon sp.]|uniref:hypothetical protein n=1 Tax=Chamaesiphon sp. TaxID=2814140 RepID=UPI0035938009